jgi:hypothetical protein
MAAISLSERSIPMPSLAGKRKDGCDLETAMEKMRQALRKTRSCNHEIQITGGPLR